MLRAGFARSAVDVLELSTEDDLVDAVVRFTDLRKRRSRISGSAPLTRGARVSERGVAA
jgi:hypothetical protein